MRFFSKQVPVIDAEQNPIFRFGKRLVDVDPGVDVVKPDLELVAGLLAREGAVEEGRLTFVLAHPEVGEGCEGRNSCRSH